MGKEGSEKERTKTVYERDSAGKLTLEAKFSLEKLDKEVVRREHKESKALRDAYEETFVNLDPEYVFKRKPPQRLKWLEKAFNALLEGRLKSNLVYDLISHGKFLEGVNQSVGDAIFKLVDRNLGFFTPKQQKYFSSPRFVLYKKHAVMDILDSDEEVPVFKPAERPMKDEDKPEWKLKIERQEAQVREEEEAKREERRKQKDREAEGRSRSRSRSSGASSRVAQRQPTDEEKDDDDDEKEEKKEAPIPTVRPDGKPKVERRIDPQDGNMYSLAEFMAEYGGTVEDPPVQWVRNKHSAFLFNE